MAKKNKNKRARPMSRSQRITMIVTGVIAVLMALSMILAMLPPPPALLLPGLWF